MTESLFLFMTLFFVVSCLFLYKYKDINFILYKRIYEIIQKDSSLKNRQKFISIDLDKLNNEIEKLSIFYETWMSEAENKYVKMHEKSLKDFKSKLRNIKSRNIKLKKEYEKNNEIFLINKVFDSLIKESNKTNKNIKLESLVDYIELI